MSKWKNDNLFEGERTCTRCNETKPIEEFRLRVRSGKQVRIERCRDCERADRREHYHANKDKRKRKSRAGLRQAHQSHHLTKEQYDELFAKQNGSCANPYCSNPATVIDHDHKCCPGQFSCGKCVRGLLCGQCNTAEGMLGGSAVKAYGLIQYMIGTGDLTRYMA